MRVELGSWRDPEVARDVKILSVLALITVLAVVVPSGLVWLVLGPIILGALAAVLMVLRRGRRPSLDSGTELPHPGINMSRISPAGIPGLAFAIGFVWMFWFGVPGFRPVVVAIAIVGCITGVALVAIERRHRAPTDTPLGLSAHQTLDKKDAAPWW